MSLQAKLIILTQPTITIKDLQQLTGQSYEKSRQDFKKIKLGYIKHININSEHNKINLPNQRELPLNKYIQDILETYYGLNKENIINNITILEKLNIK